MVQFLNLDQEDTRGSKIKVFMNYLTLVCTLKHTAATFDADLCVQ